MAETKITCPECGKVLRPAKPLPAGKRVKCPQCSALFVPDEEEDASSALSKSPAKSKAKAAAKAKPAAADNKPAKAKSVPKAGDDDDDEGGPSSYDFIDDHSKQDEPEVDYVPDTSIQDLRGPAVEAVMRPTNFMILSGVIGCLCYFFFLLIITIPIIFPVPQPTNADGSPVVAKPDEKKEAKNDDEPEGLFNVMGWNLLDIQSYNAGPVLGLILGNIVGIVFCGVLVYGAVRMQKLESRLWGFIASIMLMTPTSAAGTFIILEVMHTAVFGLFCGLGFVLFTSPIIVLASWGLNLAIGAWNLVLLLRPDIIEGFEYVPADQRRAKRQRD